MSFVHVSVDAPALYFFLPRCPHHTIRLATQQRLQQQFIRYDAIIEKAQQSHYGLSFSSNNLCFRQVIDVKMISTGTRLNHLKQSMAGVQALNDLRVFDSLF